jgi:hypothetical protein
MTMSIRVLVAGQGVHNFAAGIEKLLGKARLLPKLQTYTEKGKSRGSVIINTSQTR